MNSGGGGGGAGPGLNYLPLLFTVEVCSSFSEGALPQTVLSSAKL